MCRMNLTSGESECMSFCALNGQTPCSCGDPYECVVCCKSELGQCAPAIVDNTTLPLSNGAGCRDDSRVCIDVSCLCVCVCVCVCVSDYIDQLLLRSGSVHG